MRLRNMLKICLVFWTSEPQYAYKRYAYKKTCTRSKVLMSTTFEHMSLRIRCVTRNILVKTLRLLSILLNCANNVKIQLEYETSTHLP